jgi:hypothetical protein
MSQMRPVVSSIVEALLSREEHVISLDTIGEAVGAAAVTPADIEEIFGALEAAGRQVQRVTPNVRQHLGQVLREARRVRADGRNPTVESIASTTGLPESAVRAALLYASVLGR